MSARDLFRTADGLEVSVLAFSGIGWLLVKSAGDLDGPYQDHADAVRECGELMNDIAASVAWIAAEVKRRHC